MNSINIGLWKDIVRSNMAILGASHYDNDPKRYASELALAVQTLKLIMVQWLEKDSRGDKDSISPESALHVLSSNDKRYGIIKSAYDLYDFYIVGDCESVEVTESMILIAFNAIDYAIELYNRVSNPPANWITSQKMAAFVKPFTNQ